MKTIGKIILGLTIPLLLAGSGCGVYYGIQYHNIKQEEVKDDSGVTNLVSDLRKNISNLEKEKAELNSQILQLSAQIEALTAVNADNKTTIESLQNDIKTLNAQIINLNNQIKYYQEFIKAYENLNKLVVTFKVNGETVSVQFVENGEKVNQNIINFSENKDEKFLGWTLNGEIVDLSTFIITEDVELEAKIITKNGTFSNGEYTLIVSDNKIVDFNGNISERDKNNSTDEHSYSHFIEGPDDNVYFTLTFDKEAYNWVYEVSCGEDKYIYTLVRVEG